MEQKKELMSKVENPDGLHGKYYIQKISHKKTGYDFFGDPIFTPVLENVDDESEYFVLRLDNGGSDPVHTEACRKAVLVYAELIKDHIPQLSKDLFERYGA